MNLSKFYENASNGGRVRYVGQSDEGVLFALIQERPLGAPKLITQSDERFPKRLSNEVKAYFSTVNGKLNSWSSQPSDKHDTLLTGKMEAPEIKFVKTWAVIRDDKVVGSFDRQQHAIAFAHSWDRIVECEGAYT